MSEVEEIWNDDLLGRHQEALMIEGYLESVYARASIREDVQSYTLAVEAGYGEGKTFFLRRLARQLQASHPVAFVDAWADDIADEPLTALAATLQTALRPWLESKPLARVHWDQFLSRAGKVAKIAGSGALKRGVDFALGMGASAAIQTVLTTVDSEIIEKVDNSIDDAAKDIVDSAADKVSEPFVRRAMEQRIDRFHESIAAVRETRESLRRVLQDVEGSALSPPIIIIIDELDRCRPTYAIKVFEEIKHLFDIKGLVFILGTNTEQLSRAVGAVYGLNFDGANYLRRFIQRHYRLREPDLLPLVQLLGRNLPLDDRRLYFPTIRNVSVKMQQSHEAILTRYMVAYKVSARETFQVFDILQTCFDLTSNARLHGVYLLPLIIGHIRGLGSGELPVPSSDFGFAMNVSGMMTAGSAIQEPGYLAQRFQELCRLNRDALIERYNRSDSEYPEQAVMESISNDQQHPLASAKGYPLLLQTVGRFNLPSQDDVAQ